MFAKCLLLFLLFRFYHLTTGNTHKTTTTRTEAKLSLPTDSISKLNPLDKISETRDTTRTITDKTIQKLDDPLITEIVGFTSPNNELPTTVKSGETSFIDSKPFNYNNGDGDNILPYNAATSNDPVQTTERDYTNNCKLCKNQNVEISGLQYDVRNDTVFVSWDRVDENETIHECKYNYTTEIIAFNNFIRYDNNPGIHFPAKQICGAYELELSAENHCFVSASSSLILNVPPELGTFSINTDIANNSTLLVKMTHFQNWATCNTTGWIQIGLVGIGDFDQWLKNFTLYSHDSSATIEFNQTVPCARYNVTAYFSTMNMTFSKSKIVEMPSAKPPGITMRERIVGSRFAELSLILPSEDRYMCHFPRTVIKCGNVTKTFTPSDEGFTITGLSPFTKYNCTAKVFIDKDEFSKANLTFTTLQDAPDQVRNLEVLNVTDTSFIVNWQNPENLNGVLTEFELSIEGKPYYNMPSYCLQNEYNLTIPYRNVNKATHSLMVDSLSENYEYTVTVRAKTVSFGAGDTNLVRTSSPKPQKVENLNYNIAILKANEPVANFRWKYPCRTFASPESIQFLIRVHAEGHNNKSSNQTYKMDVNPEVQELENLTYDLPLWPSSNYAVEIITSNLETNETSNPFEVHFSSPIGNTSKPLDLHVVQEEDLMNISWTKPEIIFGTFTNYQINIISLGPLHPNICNHNMASMTYSETTSGTNFLYTNPYPHHKYKIEVAAVTSESQGAFLTVEYVTKGQVSEPVRNLECEILENDFVNYNASVLVRYEAPCSLNGLLKYYQIVLSDEQGMILHNQSEVGLFHHIPETAFSAERKYLVTVEVVNDHGSSIGQNREFQTPAGIPHEVKLDEQSTIVKKASTEVVVALRNDYFDNDYGEIRYYAILVGVKDKWNKQISCGEWNDLWPDGNFWNDEHVTYQATPAYWREPLRGAVKEYLFTLGTDNCTNAVQRFCNGPLKSNTEYNLVIRGFTSKGYRDSNKLSFTTLKDLDKWNNVALIIGIVAGVLIVVLIAGLGCLYWRRRPPKPSSEMAKIPTEEPESLFPISVKVEDFPKYYNSRKAILPDEYASLAKVGEHLEKSIAEMQENRKKNRYINILPYDCTRVASSDCNSYYINASYIKGYSEKVEYIATQGPLESTIVDFWRMIIAENCSLIAMVAQFQEQNKIKCNEYFPKSREQMDLDTDDTDGMTIRCSYELNFGFYVERQILVQTGDKQHTITHLQFLNWPDFGCPEGTANMLQFTMLLRKYMEANNSISVIHCSAGVGRTGTLIAVDILLQVIRDNKEINIHETVLTLRQQRQKMVQAEAQYLYIYKCIHDAILQPIELVELKAIDPIYENLENMIEMTVLTHDNNNFNQPQEDAESGCVDLENSINQNQNDSTTNGSVEQDVNDAEYNKFQELGCDET